MKKLIINYLLLTFIFFACQNNEAINENSSQFDKATLEIKNEISNAKPYLNESITNSDCTFHSLGQNCFTFNRNHEFNLSFPECDHNLRDSCPIIVTYRITICIEDAKVRRVHFENTLWAHRLICHNDSIPDLHDFDCFLDVTYEAFVAYMMPIIMNLYGTANYCNQGYQNIVASYSKSLCFFPCISYYDEYVTIHYEPCSSTGCCLTETSWCYDNNGNPIPHSQTKTQIGVCSAFGLPCIPDPQNPMQQCKNISCND